MTDDPYVPLQQFMQLQIDSLRTMLNERYETQTKALDAAFRAQQEAMQVALAAAEKAVNKAEVAADKRFELLNELRVGVATREQFEALEKAVGMLTARVDTMVGQGQTAQQWEGRKDTGISQLMSTAFLAIGVASLIVSIIVTIRR